LLKGVNPSWVCDFRIGQQEVGFVSLKFGKMSRSELGLWV